MRAAFPAAPCSRLCVSRARRDALLDDVSTLTLNRYILRASSNIIAVRILLPPPPFSSCSPTCGSRCGALPTNPSWGLPSRPSPR